MNHNHSDRLWDGFTEKLGMYTSDSIRRASIDEKRARMNRVAQVMWHTFNCHNFAEVFRNAYADELNDPSLSELRGTIGSTYGYTHDLAWALIGLEEQMDWTKHYSDFFGEMIELTLSQIAKNDEVVRECVEKMVSSIE